MTKAKNTRKKLKHRLRRLFRRRNLISMSLVALATLVIIFLLDSVNHNKPSELPSKTCSNCGTNVSASANFCQYCGTDLREQTDVPDLPVDDLPIDGYIELSTAEEIYALARMSYHQIVKDTYLGPLYDVNNDIDLFDIPEELDDTQSKIDYLLSARYKLENDVELVIQAEKGQNYFVGIGDYGSPFKGIFNGNGKTVTLKAVGNISMTSVVLCDIGFFSSTQGARISGLNVKIVTDIVIDKANTPVRFGALAGFSADTKIDNCNVTYEHATLGVSFGKGEELINISRIGGLVGVCQYSTIQNCKVSMTDSTICAKGYDVSAYTSTYAYFSVGGFIGFSMSGSDNTNNIGVVGNQLLNCEFISQNSNSMNTLLASIEQGDEVDAGGLVGCAFNNFIAKNCSVQIARGNIVAEKTGSVDNAKHGVNAGGLLGRLEHTGELNNCHVDGDYMYIVSRSPENYSTAGGLVGYDMGAYHRECVSLNNCSIDGSGTSKIVMEVSDDPTVSRWSAVGGIAGIKYYTASGCTAHGVTLVNNSVGTDKSFVGGLFGIFGRETGLWSKGTYFTPNASEIKNCTTTAVFFEVVASVTTHNICPIYE